MTFLAQEILNGLVLGSIYSLVATGLTLVYGVMEIPNFAHGHLYMLGAYITLFLLVSAHFSYWPAALAAAVVLSGVGALLEWVVFRPLRHALQVHAMIASVGVMLFLEALAQWIWGPDFQRMPTPYGRILNVAGLTISEQQLVIVLAALMCMGLLYLFLKHTTLGMAMEAVAQNRAGAQLVGIPTQRISLLAFALSAALASLAASLIAPIHLIFPAMGLMVIMKAFAIIVIGGMGSVPGAIAGGYILALAESIGGAYVSTNYQDVIAFALLVLILSVRPTGLFTRRV
ncbi:MAG: branched-chain amino acid ABC transporter permease [Alicyclobacillus macrosporangiidus]|uniref:branched-chain amino acid ABC transporter permease n=1 Tax=Alicyclobacillus macrosporangiidus TaxID=392015 RepID=UPI0026F2AFC7|nr:branched-chain amino acid ABC transporter permease [Alicyclobacillus macrosporangiidus]MCL6597587.1 branched-chain amino acid ABC transporter permease [Alicyclobacillus macrosporangiidus]